MTDNDDNLRDDAKQEGNHTPGPWSVLHRNTQCDPYCDERYGLGLDIVGPEQASNRGQFARAADARLIARAPELLAENERLKMSISLCSGSCGFPEFAEKNKLKIERLESVNAELLGAVEGAMRIESLWRLPDDADLDEGAAVEMMRKSFQDAIARARGSEEQPEGNPETCEWREDGSAWLSDCGEGFHFTSDGPTENKFKFCPYCGKAVNIAKARGVN